MERQLLQSSMHGRSSSALARFRVSLKEMHLLPREALSRVGSTLPEDGWANKLRVEDAVPSKLEICN